MRKPELVGTNWDDRIRRRSTAAKSEVEKLRAEAGVTSFWFTPRLLLRHVLIIGATGSGKTNHAFHIIRQAQADSIFVIDVKKEYRRLKNVLDRVGDDDGGVRVLAVADEPRVKFNPLAPPPGVEADLWDRAFADVFTRAYGLSEPSRRILLDSLWELRRGREVERVTGKSNMDPTLRELENAVADFKAGSSKEQNSQRSLESRLHVINTGPVGISLNSDQPLDIESKNGAVTIFEIGRIDSVRDQRFLAELLLAHLWHRDKAVAAEEPEEYLRRLVVLEEAHRYLSEDRPPSQRGDRTLLELAIAEARRYGWGFLILDQMPSLLSRYVWDNVGTVIAHRLTNMESYRIVKGALGGHPLEDENPEDRDPVVLRLPEGLALFRRYVDPAVKMGIGVGVVSVPEVRSKIRETSDAA